MIGTCGAFLLGFLGDYGTILDVLLRSRLTLGRVPRWRYALSQQARPFTILEGPGKESQGFGVLGHQGSHCHRGEADGVRLARQPMLCFQAHSQHLLPIEVHAGFAVDVLDCI